MKLYLLTRTDVLDDLAINYKTVSSRKACLTRYIKGDEALLEDMKRVRADALNPRNLYLGEIVFSFDVRRVERQIQMFKEIYNAL